MSDTWDLPEGQTHADMAEEWRNRCERAEAARQAWAINAADESMRADALLEAAEKVVQYYNADWPECQMGAGWELVLVKLQAAVEAAKVKHD